MHVHLLGIGDRAEGVWMNPAMQSALRRPLQYGQYRFYLNAGCAEEAGVDDAYITRVRALTEGFAVRY